MTTREVRTVEVLWLLIPCSLAIAFSALPVLDPRPTVLAGSVAVAAAFAHRVGVSYAAALVFTVVVYRGLQGLIARTAGIPDAAPIVFDAVALTLFVAGCSRRISGRSDPLPWPVLLFLSLSLLSVLNPVLPSVAYGLSGLRALVLPLCVGVGVALLPFKPRDRMLILSGLFLVLVVNCLLVLRQVTLGFNGAELQALYTNLSTYDVGGSYRPLGALSSNQDVGLLLALAVPALLAGLLGTRGHTRFWVGVTLVLAGASLLSSLLRSAILAAAVGSAFVLLRSGRRGVPYRGAFRLVLAGAIFALVVTATLSFGALGERTQPVVARLQSFTELSGDRSFNARLDETLPRAATLSLANPLGLGAGAAGPVSQVNSTSAPAGPLAPDNGYLLIAIQIGWGGFIALVGLLLHLSRARAGSIKLGVSGSTSAFAVAMLLGGYWSLLGPATIYFCYVGLSGALLDRRVD